MSAADASARLVAPVRWRAWEVVLWVAIWIAPFALPQYAALINEIAIFALFAVSLDIVLGYAGIVSLGHAAFFGAGGYASALLAKHLIADPLVGLALGTAIGAALGALTSPMIVRGTDLTRLMVTMGVALVLLELANKFDNITGGADGLQGVVTAPLFGVFEFDLAARIREGRLVQKELPAHPSREDGGAPEVTLTGPQEVSGRKMSDLTFCRAISSADEATIHHELAADHVGSVVAGKEEDRPCDLDGFREAAQGNGFGGGLRKLGGGRPQSGEGIRHHFG